MAPVGVVAEDAPVSRSCSSLLESTVDEQEIAARAMVAVVVVVAAVDVAVFVVAVVVAVAVAVVFAVAGQIFRKTAVDLLRGVKVLHCQKEYMFQSLLEPSCQPVG